MNQDEYMALVTEVNRLRNESHLFNNDEISEEALDNLKHKITLYEKQNPQHMSGNSPNTTIAGGILEGLKKVKHSSRMLSLGDVFSLEEMKEWDEKWKKSIQKDDPKSIQTSYYAELKLDGMALILLYNNGGLVQAATRGDGWVGEDITKVMQYISSIPQTIPDTRKLEIKGELVMTKKDLEELNKDIIKGEKKGKFGKTGKDAQFANPRNVVAGSVRNLDTSVIQERVLHFIAYGLRVID